MLAPLGLLALACQQADPPPAPPAVIAPGTYLTDGFPLEDGQEVLAICGDRLERLPLSLERTGEQVTPQVSCAWQALLGGIDDRVGTGSIAVGPIGSLGALSPPATVNVGLVEARIHGKRSSETGYRVVVRAGERFVLAEVDSPPDVSPTLIWAGDLDNDHAVDWILDTPSRDGTSHYRLYLTAKQPDGRPEEVSSSILRRQP